MNENYFNSIDTPEKAYIIGFFIGDGSLGDDKNKHDYGVIFYQDAEDKYILDLIRKEMSIEKEIIISSIPNTFKNKNKYYGHNVAILRATNKTLHNDLKKLVGCTNRKTYEKFHLPKIDVKLIPYLILGYFDSDGCLSITKRQSIRHNKTKEDTIKYSMTCKWFICGKNEIILKDIQDFFNQNNISTKLAYDKTKDFYYLRTCSKKEILKIYTLLYNNAPFYLKRKEEKYSYAKLTPSEFWKLKSSEPCNA